MLLQVYIFLTTLLFANCGVIDNSVNYDDKDDMRCQLLPKKLVNEIRAYAGPVQDIIEEATKGSFKGFAYNELSKFVDKFGNRMAGTENLENSIDYMLDRAKSLGLDNVHGEEVQIPRWVRGKESATLLKPRVQNLPMLGLGYSIGTPLYGITAEVLVVKTFSELTLKAAEAKGKIVVFNQEYINYDQSLQYRLYGASEASKVGAVASLIRSVTPFSMQTPHTGMQTYRDNVTKIPTACITIEDAKFLQRLQDRGEMIKIRLRMDAKMEPDVTSRNTVIELKGSVEPEKVVIVSGHLDSWDVGQGAMDDGAGAFISWAALALLKELGLTPRRTMRAILWTSEEMGAIGAKAYKEAHLNESSNLVFIMEADLGTFTPLGIQYSTGPNGACILKEIMQLLQPISATQAEKSSDLGSDIGMWAIEGFPGATLMTKNEVYYWVYHTEADTLNVEDPNALNMNTALWASVAYVIANLEQDFPRD